MPKELRIDAAGEAQVETTDDCGAESNRVELRVLRNNKPHARVPGALCHSSPLEYPP
jgi:hypothetical protein